MITEKQPSASAKPVTQLGSNLLADLIAVLNFFTSILLTKMSKQFIRFALFPVKTAKKVT
jgi:hypothetical protein